MLSGVMKSSELSKIFRRKELADNPTFNSAEGYELSLQHSLLQARETSRESLGKDSKFRADYPKNLGFTSDITEESVYSMRKKLRSNMFDHKNYDANLDQPEFRAVVNKVYDP